MSFSTVPSTDPLLSTVLSLGFTIGHRLHQKPSFGVESMVFLPGFCSPPQVLFRPLSSSCTTSRGHFGESQVVPDPPLSRIPVTLEVCTMEITMNYILIASHLESLSRKILWIKTVQCSQQERRQNCRMMKSFRAKHISLNAEYNYVRRSPYEDLSKLMLAPPVSHVPLHVL